MLFTMLSIARTMLFAWGHYGPNGSAILLQRPTLMAWSSLSAYSPVMRIWEIRQIGLKHPGILLTTILVRHVVAFQGIIRNFQRQERHFHTFIESLNQMELLIALEQSRRITSIAWFMKCKKEMPVVLIRTLCSKSWMRPSRVVVTSMTM